MLLPPTPLKFRKPATRGRGVRFGPPPPLPVPLELMSAEFHIVGATKHVTIYFDRAIDIAGLAGAQISVQDGSTTHRQYLATGTAVMVNDTGVDIVLVDNGAFAPDDFMMSATGSTGIVAVDDGGTWEGVLNLPLPYP